ncbi:MAG: helix-turn-helix domain-containing protein [Beijerinckiaceae bacterium]
MNILPVQCKMARAGLDLAIRDLAQRAKVSPHTIARFERGELLKVRTIKAIETALQSAGIEFLSENNVGGTGVRLPKTAPRGAIAIDVEDLNSENDE